MTLNFLCYIWYQNRRQVQGSLIIVPHFNTCGQKCYIEKSVWPTEYWINNIWKNMVNILTIESNQNNKLDFILTVTNPLMISCWVAYCQFDSFLLHIQALFSIRSHDLKNHRWESISSGVICLTHIPENWVYLLPWLLFCE